MSKNSHVVMAIRHKHKIGEWVDPLIIQMVISRKYHHWSSKTFERTYYLSPERARHYRERFFPLLEQLARKNIEYLHREDNLDQEKTAD